MLTSGFITNRGRLKTGLLIVVVVCLLAGGAQAQFYFGKNKIQYATFDWQVMTTDHFRIYFYQDELDIAKIAARIAEDAYHPMAARFNLELKKKVPLIIYSSSAFFAQTNVTSGILPESVAGFTEFYKGRVVVPFHGSFRDFEHVIVHELVHVFTLSKLSAIIDRQAHPRWAFPPLWFMEGLAEFWSEPWDTEADMIVKDMVINDRMLGIEDLWRVQGSYFMYKLGQSVCQFINDEYGEDKLLMIFENWTKGRRFDEILSWTLGEELKEVSRKWKYYLKKKYYPEMSELGLPVMESEQLSHDGYCVKGVPIDWDDGEGTDEWVVYMAHRMGYSGIYMKPRRSNGQGVKTLVKGERSIKFESLYLLRSGIDATDSGLVAFSSKSKEKDVIYIYDLNEMKIAGEYRLENLVAARSPRFSPDGRRIVFTGIMRGGHSDIFVLHLESGVYEAVTDDVYDDTDPAFSLDGYRIVFASDRGQGGDAGATSLWELDLRRSGSLRQLTWGAFRDQTPDVSAEGVYFSSDREGSYNLFLLDEAGGITRQSAYVTGAFDPRLTSDGTQLIYSGYQGMQFNVYQMDLVSKPEPVAAVANVSGVGWKPGFIDTVFVNASVKYDTDYSFDIAQSTISYDPVYGSAGGVQAAVSDILGDHAFYFLLSNTAETRDDILESFNFGVTYINKQKRVNWGVGFFHLFDEYYNDVDQYYFERQVGAVGLVSYPISRFSRFDFSNYARYDKKDRRFGLQAREAFLLTNYLSWVYDNSIWDISGPIEGRRYNLTVGITHSLSDMANWNRVAFADIRHYLRLGKYSAFANRLFGYSSTGLEPQRIYLGGSWSFRGYDRRAFYNRNVLLASNEIRFPLIDALLIGLPIGGMDFRGIRGALFFDVGSAWEDEFDQFLGSYGWGFRVSLGYVVLLRFDFARTTDFHTVSPDFDFDFFFGWNF
ncbi:MAG: hypothetical protein GY867_08775 [bacterium]|nr:hypothetical protein [bacterium]